MDEGLAKDLIRRNKKLGNEEALLVSSKLSEAATEAVASLKAMLDTQCGNAAAAQDTVLVAEDEQVVTLRLSQEVGNDGDKPRMAIAVNNTHYQKLRRLFGNSHHTQDDAAASDDQRFHCSVWCLLTRYDTLRPHGYQAALSHHGFKVLEQRLGVDCECFASQICTGSRP